MRGLPHIAFHCEFELLEARSGDVSILHWCHVKNGWSGHGSLVGFGLVRPLTAANKGARLFSERPKMSISCQLHLQRAPDSQNTIRARMTRRPLAAE